jgi:hypothetical protein
MKNITKPFTRDELTPFIGRKFLLRHTRYGELDGLVGTVVEVDSTPICIDEEVTETAMLVVETPNPHFSMAIMFPYQFASEVKS